MDEYIEREAAIKAIEKADYTLIANDADDCKADYLREIIESVPAADAVPVMHGRWEQTEAPFMNECEDCSVCGYRTVWGHRFNYCPNCGAKMNESKCEGVQYNG